MGLTNNLVTFSSNFKTVNNLLLGKDQSNVPVDVRVLNNSVLHDLNMGYYGLANKTPHSPVLWRSVEQEFFHPLSIEKSCETYAYSKLNDLIELNDFMNLPNVVVEQMLDGLIKGKKKREEEEESLRSSKTLTAEERESERIIKESQKIMDQLG